MTQSAIKIFFELVHDETTTVCGNNTPIALLVLEETIVRLMRKDYDIMKIA